MKIVTEYPHSIHEIENTWVPLADGTRLAARIWLPVDAEQTPVPAILEYLPYRKNDSTAERDALMHPYIAGHGYACVRVDMRGNGDSDGVLMDEYLKQEQDDGLEVLSWLAAQPWCTGSVGMIGISWGGFNGLQIAARRPPELKAIITLCSTDDRYNDDCHYMGGCLLASDMTSWASIMFAINSKPPDPKHVGERWRAMWLHRLNEAPPFLHAWLTHQRRDDYWKHGSVIEDYSAIDCPVFAVGGWADAYTNSIPRLLAGLTVPRKGLIGPWAHAYPFRGTPGPAIGFLQETLRWWDRWLKGIDTGMMDEPMLRTWINDSYPPAVHYEQMQGRWVDLAEWPSSRVQYSDITLQPSLSPDALFTDSQTTEPIELKGSQFTGSTAGVWCPYGAPGDMPSDQRADDARSICFASAMIKQAYDVLGFPDVTLTLTVDQPKALVAVRLCDVSPTGESTLVSWGLLNLTQRKDHERVELLEPGCKYDVTVRLNAIGYRIAAGHHWRVAVSPTYWPHAWPSPVPVTLRLYPEECGLMLPVLDDQEGAQTGSAIPHIFGEPECATPMQLVEVRPESPRNRTVFYDPATRTSELLDHSDDGIVRYPDGLEYELVRSDLYRIKEGDPLSAYVRCAAQIAIGRGDWRTRIETVNEMTGDAENFHLTNRLDAYEGEKRIFSKTWALSIPRDGL